MNRKFFVASLGVLAFVFSSKASFSYDFLSYIPTLDKEEIMDTDIKSAYFSDLFVEKAEDDADFFMYEDVNGEKEVVHYYLNYGIRNNVESAEGIRVYDPIDLLEGHYISFVPVDEYYYSPIYNTSSIGSVYGDFIGTFSEGSGGAIFNEWSDSSSIGSVVGDFIHNRVQYGGGAIFNSSVIDSIKGIFAANSVAGGGYGSAGGAIYNRGLIKEVEGDFIGNSVLGFYISGGAIYNDYYSVIEVLKGNFIGNFVKSQGQGSEVKGGAIYNDFGSQIDLIEGGFYGNLVVANGEFSSTRGGAVYNLGSIFDLNSSFISNAAISSSDSWGGAIYNSSRINFIKGDFIGNRVEQAGFQSDWNGAFGGAMYNQGISPIARMTAIAPASVDEDTTDYNILDIQGNFINNSAVSYRQAKGGAIYNNGAIKNITGDIIGNYVSGDYGKIGGGAIYNEGTIGISTTTAKKRILIENNKLISNSDGKDPIVSLNFMDLYAYAYGDRSGGETTYHWREDAVLNLTTIAGSYIDIRDPFRSLLDYYVYDQDLGMDIQGLEVGGKGGFINKTGEGAMCLWGDNSEYGGKLDIKEGSFYAMFDDVQDEAHDTLGQRLYFTLRNADVTFEDGTVFRPKVTKNTMADLGAKATVNGNVVLVPYNMSSLDTGAYTYRAENSGFSGWDSTLAKVDISADDSTTLEVKRNLSGYEGLSDLADIYRKRTDLSEAERTEIDDIYYTGKVSSATKEKFAVVSGKDKVVYTEVYKASVRQFGRQIASRIQNKNCKSCGIENGFSDEHFWFNMGQNAIDRKTKGDNLGYKYSPTSLAVGYDHDFLPDELNVGLALSYAFGDVKGKGENIVNKADVNEYLVSLYTKYKPLRAYVTGSIGGGVIQTKTKMVSNTVNVRGQYDTKVFFANSEFGYDFGSSCGVIEPFAGLEYAYIYNPSYNEKGIGARHFDSMDWTSIELPVGLRISRNITYENYMLTPAVEVAYSRNVGDKGTKVNSYFVGNPNSPWVIRGADDSRDSVRGSFNLKINNSETPFAFNVGYARDSRSDYKDDQVYVTMRYNF